MWFAWFTKKTRYATNHVNTTKTYFIHYCFRNIRMKIEHYVLSYIVDVN